jgi:hypothetical protein
METCMKTIVLTATVALLLAAASGTTPAQSAPNEKFLKPPVFLLMPGGLTTCVISCPAGKSRTDFNARFQTVIPTSQSWLAFVAGAQWGWFSDEAHGPLGFFGGIIPIVPLNNALDGWLSISFDPLGVTSGPGTKGTNLVLEGAAVAPVGAKMMSTMPFFRGIGLYFLIDQQLTNLATDVNGNRDRFNPALVYGVLWQVAP